MVRIVQTTIKAGDAHKEGAPGREEGMGRREWMGGGGEER